MNAPRLVKCLTAKYDEEDKFLVLFCLFEDVSEKRFVYFSRDDFHFKGEVVPDAEMHKTAQLFRGKRFWLTIHDDPNRNQEAENNPIALAAEFRKAMAEELAQISQGLSDDRKIIQRKLGDIVEREQDAMGLLNEELAIRAKWTV